MREDCSDCANTRHFCTSHQKHQLWVKNNWMGSRDTQEYSDAMMNAGMKDACEN